MNEKISKFLKRNFFVLGIITIAGILAWTNYTPNTWLIGWDSLHPEFDFGLNLKRLIFGVWREEQGLGALSAHAQISDLPRQIFLLISSLFFPESFLRYFYFFSALILGPLGVYLFILDFQKKPAAFLGSLFYLLNLGTLQHFYVPFEMFAALYAGIGWLFWFCWRFIQKGEKKYLLAFMTATFASSPMAYASSLWFVFLLMFLIFAFSLYITWRTRTNLHRTLVLIILMLTINSFWLLPNLYWMATDAKNVSSAKINQLFSERAFLEDSKFATLGNAVILKSFLFDWQEFQKGEFVPLLSAWQKHLANPLILAIGYLSFGMVALGIFSAFVKRKAESLILFPVLFIAFIFLIHNQPPIDQLFAIFRKNKLFEEGLRFPWTKFSIPVMLAFSFYFACGFAFVLEKIRSRLLRVMLPVLISIALVVWMLPAFSGNLIDKNRRTAIPDDYFQAYKWFSGQLPSGRIAAFPIPTFWGWEYRNWGFEGAGFIWFGLKQSVLVRDFDRWNPNDENFYWEISYALYSKNLDLFENVLNKYQISWLLLDRSTINPSFSFALYFDEFKELTDKSNKIKTAASFGKLDIYKVDLKTSDVFLLQKPANVEPSYKWNNLDQAYLDYGTYISTPIAQNSSSIYYPFRSLFTGKKQNDIEFTPVEERDNLFIFKKNVPPVLKTYNLAISQANEELLHLKPEIEFDGKRLEVKVPKIAGPYSAVIDPVKLPLQTPVNCNKYSTGLVKSEVRNQMLRLTAQNAEICSTSYLLPDLPHKFSYLISVESKNIKGTPLIFWLENPISRKPDIETYLPKQFNLQSPISNFSYFIQPPMEPDGLGYTLHFDTRSIGQEESINELGEISVQPIPYKFLTSLKLVPNGYVEPKTQLINVTEVKHPNPSIYEIYQFPITNSQYLVLSQSFHYGWKAYLTGRPDPFLLAPILGQKLEDHVLVNNWANGWQLNNIAPDKKIVIIFLPQYLEYIGFALFLASFGYLLFKR